MLEVLTVPLNLSLITLFSVTLCGVDLVDFENLHKLYNIAPCVDSCQGMILHSCIHLIFGLLLHQHMALPDTILIVLSETGKNKTYFLQSSLIISYLFTIIGTGRAMMKTPSKAQSPPISYNRIRV